MEINQSIEIMKSLADTSRLRVLNLLFEKPNYVEELANKLNLAVSTVSFHLKKLENAGLVYKQKEQYYVIYHIKDEIFNLTLRQFANFNNLDDFEQKERIKRYEEKVIKIFFKNKKLVKLPVQYKKKLIVVKEFLKLLIPDKKYSEKEINEIFSTYFDDYCTVRRILIDEGYLQRENQIYWLNKEVKND